MADTADLTARIAELAALIESGLAQDETVALATIGINELASMRRGAPPPRWVSAEDSSDIRSDDRYGILRVRHTWAAERAHIIRNDPARVLRRVKATRELVAEILAEPHLGNQNSFFLCSQAERCSDPDRAGKPCDCGRDARVARLLGIIASEWEATA